IKEATSEMGQKSNDVTNAVSSQLNRQLQNHNLSGTLIITATCTHKNVSTINPFVIDVDNCVSIWKETFPSPADQINLSQAMQTSSPEAGGTSENAKYLNIVSGASYGSSFVGMVHFIKQESAENDVDADTIKKLSEKL